MSQVSTVRGPVEVADLGPTYMHEHIFVLTADVQQNYPGEWGGEDERIADAVTKLGALAAQGVRTIVVTCTNGELGDGPGGIKPGDAGHDTEAVAATRLGELRKACELLGVTTVELLGYHDSGMADWHYNDDERAFSAQCRAAGGIVPLPHSLPRFVVIGSDLDGNDALTGRRHAECGRQRE